MQESLPEEDTSSPQSNNVRVVIRVRPLLPKEKRNDLCTLLRTNIQSSDVTLRTTSRARGDVIDKRFHFDGLLDATATQEDTFAALRVNSLVKAVIQGYNATIFAYGQTGSGKTYTMEGYDYEDSTSVTADRNARVRPVPKVQQATPDKMGVVPRALSVLFQQIEQERNRCASTNNGEMLSVRCTFVQIYNEKVLDLLNDTGAKGPGLRLRWNQQRGFYAENLYVVEVETVEDALRVFHTGLRGKVMASHRMNAASSRSHCIFRVHVEREKGKSGMSGGVGVSGTVLPTGASQHVTSSSMCFVDLAGSEKATQTGATGVTLNESIGINTSLQVLRRVITALAKKPMEDDDSVSNHSQLMTSGSGKRNSQHVPYRDSKLTSLLQHAIGGNSITVMVACLSPCDRFVDENLSTLQYASQAQSIENRAVVNVDPGTKLIRRLKNEIKKLRKDLKESRRLAEIAQFAVLDASNLSTDETSLQLRKLKKDMIDNITMIKAMYTNESKLRHDHDTVLQSNAELTYHNSQLHTENAKLREDVFRLKESYSTSKNKNNSNSNSNANIDTSNVQESMTIPGYGIARRRSDVIGESGGNDGSDGSDGSDGKGGTTLRLESARTDNGSNSSRTTGRRRGGEGDVVESNGGGGGFFDMIGDNATTATKEFRSVDVGGGWMNNTTASTATTATATTTTTTSAVENASNDFFSSMMKETPKVISPTTLKQGTVLRMPPTTRVPLGNTNGTSNSALLRAGHDLMSTIGNINTNNEMKNSSNLSLMSQSVGNNASTGIGGGHNVLNEKEDMIGRHNGFEKRTFGYVPPVKGKGKKKNIINAYGPGGAGASGALSNNNGIPPRNKRIKSGGRKRGKNNTSSSSMSTASGHLSINALKSLLGGSNGGGGRRPRGSSDGNVGIVMPGTPGVLARAMNSHNERVEKEEDEMYDYTSGGAGMGGIGLGGLGNVRWEEPS